MGREQGGHLESRGNKETRESLKKVVDRELLVTENNGKLWEAGQFVP